MNITQAPHRCDWPSKCNHSCGRFSPGRDEHQQLVDSCFMCGHSRDCHETSDEAEEAFSKGVQRTRREIRDEIKAIYDKEFEQPWGMRSLLGGLAVCCRLFDRGRRFEVSP